MPRSTPDAQLLLHLAVDHLEEELYPSLAGAQRYRLRVAINVLRIVERELALGVSLDLKESEELVALCGAFGDPSQPSLAALTSDIESGARSVDDPQLALFLRRNLERALRINNPRWIQETPSRDGPNSAPQESS